ncbi:MAG: ArsC family reductase [Chromatiales bacterium]|nr:ArsC family reductase [Gammaproteobacteria bacterium]MBW6476696.1 ArsC family reductase [Chromatiales bacterium]
MTTLYGIKNCDTVKKARKWLDQHSIDYRFHDFRQDGLEPTQLHTWSQAVGWETLLNRRGTTWRQLNQAEREEIDEDRALMLMHDLPTLIKRPVLEYQDGVVVGFAEKRYAEIFETS